MWSSDSICHVTRGCPRGGISSPVVDATGPPAGPRPGPRTTWWSRVSTEARPVALVGGLVQFSIDDKVVRVCATRHDPSKEQGVFSMFNGNPGR